MSTFDERRAQRAAWPVRVVPLSAEGELDDRDTTTIDERIALVHELTYEQWAFAGLPLPAYTRAQMPGRVIRKR